MVALVTPFVGTGQSLADSMVASGIFLGTLQGLISGLVTFTYGGAKADKLSS